VTREDASGRIGRPPLTERRKAATRLDIAREAARLFITKGVMATTADEIAAAAGVSVRTLWRYFPVKESCVLPLLSAGAQGMSDAVRAWPVGSGIDGFFEQIQRYGPGRGLDTPTLVGLVRLTRTDATLRAVWLQAFDVAEPLFAAALADRAGLDRDDLRVNVWAAVLCVGFRLAVEHYTWHGDPNDPAGLRMTLHTALVTAADGLPS
jgi:AcrR family transcriptional regulator